MSWVACHRCLGMVETRSRYGLAMGISVRCPFHIQTPRHILGYCQPCRTGPLSPSSLSFLMLTIHFRRLYSLLGFSSLQKRFSSDMSPSTSTVKPSQTVLRKTDWASRLSIGSQTPNPPLRQSATFTESERRVINPPLPPLTSLVSEAGTRAIMNHVEEVLPLVHPL